MTDHYVSPIIAHYHAFNMAAIFSDCPLGEPQTVSLKPSGYIKSLITVTAVKCVNVGRLWGNKKIHFNLTNVAKLYTQVLCVKNVG